MNSDPLPLPMEWASHSKWIQNGVATATDQRGFFDAELPASSTDASTDDSTNTIGVLTLDTRGVPVVPSPTAIEARLECLYPGFDRLLRLAVRLTTTNGGDGGDAGTARLQHVRQVAALVRHGRAQLSAAHKSKPAADVSVDGDCDVGTRVNKQMRAYACYCGPHAGKPAPPTRDELLAYKVLSPAFAVPEWILVRLVGTKWEYRLCAVPADEP